MTSKTPLNRTINKIHLLKKKKVFSFPCQFYTRLNVTWITYSGLLSKIMLHTEWSLKKFTEHIKTDKTKDKIASVTINNMNVFLSCTHNWLKWGVWQLQQWTYQGALRVTHQWRAWQGNHCLEESVLYTALLHSDYCCVTSKNDR